MPQNIMKRKQILYFGLDPTRYSDDGVITHLPLIRIEPRGFSEVHEAFSKMAEYTHVLFTSRTAVEIFVEYSKRARCACENKQLIAIGMATASRLKDFNLNPAWVAQEETGEGVVALLKTLPLHDASIFFPRSAQSREVIVQYLKEAKLRFYALTLYSTIANQVKLPNLDAFDELIFTSPSTVKAFLMLYPTLPRKKCKGIGPITEAFLIKNSHS